MTSPTTITHWRQATPTQTGLFLFSYLVPVPTGYQDQTPGLAKCIPEISLLILVAALGNHPGSPWVPGSNRAIKQILIWVVAACPRWAQAL